MSKPAVIHLITNSTIPRAPNMLMTVVRCGRSNYLSASSAPENVTCKRCRKLMAEDDVARYPLPVQCASKELLKALENPHDW